MTLNLEAIEQMADTCDSGGHVVPAATVRALVGEVRRLRAIADVQTYDLMGVVADVEQGNGFDSVCLETIKRVIGELAKAGGEKA